MKYINCVVLIVFLLFFTIGHSQSFDPSNLKSLDIDALSDEQVSLYWERAQDEGYSLGDLELIGASRGLSKSQITKLKRRIESLPVTSGIGSSSQEEVVDSKVVRKAPASDERRFGRGELENTSTSISNPLFGFDFFNNPNISFEPALNLATPENYQLGPGDQITISVFGAAEDVFERTVGANGSINIPNLGPIVLSGLTIKEARTKVNGRFKSIYSGISAQENSPYRVNVDLSLTGIRRVQVNIIGQVKVPGTYSLSALSNVLNALYAAGGPTENGTFRNILIVRDGIVIGNFDIYKYIISGNTEGNLFIKDQDAIIVRPYDKRVNVTGEVKRPGLYEVLPNESFTDLSLYFGGFTSNAYKEKVVIERVEGAQRSVKEIDVSESNVALVDGDLIDIQPITDRFVNKITIEGSIYRPGSYELQADMKLSDLLQKSLGPTDDAFLERAILYRTNKGLKKEAISFSINEVVSGDFDILLKREDAVKVFSSSSLEDSMTLSINGAVNDPKTIPFIDGLKVGDLIALGGGFRDGADPLSVDVFRRVVDEDLSTESKILKWSGNEELSVGINTDFELKPFDRISVRFRKGFVKQQSVSVKGEVFYPGEYSIVSKNDRVSDLIQNAGGLSPYANIKGATLIRKLRVRDEKTQRALVENLSDDGEIINENNDKEFRIALDLEKILSSNKNKLKYDIILEEGDQLTIPSFKQTVEVRGEVLAPALIRFDKRKSLKSYINGSGGFTSNAKKGKVYVIKANGEVSSTKKFLFFRNYPDVEPGSVILIPPKPERTGGLSVQEIIGITTGLGTLGLLVDRLAN
ncbi:SLBB domain-containing protein [Dokdonia sp. 4H-3-7-5]|uniref:SLBB domain-containing protein n=1 Tax=Dokdonia sp. (strain 4H-3-7-5) TaxID=983548 RepID=UPI00020A6DEB|nr:SLBB domain-containing protein [Dokdonia sp. 4H-3-7-5]AEE20757.1 polysaccharide export protein [Dokdonia sp. 4H-3-7-5]